MSSDPPSGKKALIQGTASHKPGVGRAITAFILRKGHNDPLVDALLLELDRARAQTAGATARYNEAVLAFGDEALERRRAEDRLDRERTLRQLLEDRIERQIAATKLAEGLLKRRSDFVAHMVHQLKTPLTVILGYVPILSGRLDDTATKGMLDLIGRAGEGMTETVNMVLDFFQAEAGKLQVGRETVDVGAEIAVVAGFMQPVAAGKRVTLALDTPEQVYAELDPRLLNHVMVNLISNGIKYNRQDGRVTVSVEKRGGRVAISVSDTGIGIRSGDIPKLFEPFGRLNGSEGIEGTGLGLVVVKKFTELMDGTISVESAEGKGTTFTIAFPLAQQ